MSEILTAYFKQVGRHKLLTKQEEISRNVKVIVGPHAFGNKTNIQEIDARQKNK